MFSWITSRSEGFCHSEDEPAKKNQFKGRRLARGAALSTIAFNLVSQVQIGLAREADSESFTTTYVNKYFEVRQHDVPTKFVFSGETRVARLTGSLSTNPRNHRLRVLRGWNLIS